MIIRRYLWMFYGFKFMSTWKNGFNSIEVVARKFHTQVSSIQFFIHTNVPITSSSLYVQFSNGDIKFVFVLVLKHIQGYLLYYHLRSYFPYNKMMSFRKFLTMDFMFPKCKEFIQITRRALLKEMKFITNINIQNE